MFFSSLEGKHKRLNYFLNSSSWQTHQTHKWKRQHRLVPSLPEVNQTLWVTRLSRAAEPLRDANHTGNHGSETSNAKSWPFNTSGAHQVEEALSSCYLLVQRGQFTASPWTPSSSQWCKSAYVSHQVKVKIGCMVCSLVPQREKKREKHLYAGPVPMPVIPSYYCFWIKAFVLNLALWWDHLGSF